MPGCFCAEGMGGAQDHVKVVEWLEKAVAQGHADAQYCPGYLFESGQGVPQDCAKAGEWYAQAAQGHVEAQKRLKRLKAGSPDPAARIMG